MKTHLESPQQTSGFTFRLPTSSGETPDRSAAILAETVGRKVLHVGCADSPLTEDKLRRGTLLHSTLMTHCRSVVGVDYDEVGLRELATAVPGDYRLIDVTSWDDVASLHELDFDTILVGDVIEHVPNAGLMLENLLQLSRLKSGASRRIIVTTPNALGSKVFLPGLLRREFIHPDHVALYSPTSLAALMRRTGWLNVRVRYYTESLDGSAQAKVFNALRRASLAISSATADGLIVSAESR